jgi:predicted metal-binding protein
MMERGEHIEKVRGMALECGFSRVGNLDPAKITLRTEVRATCAENKCGAYGTRWSCPPGCGTLEENAERIKQFQGGFILQTTGELEDELDGEGMMETAKTHGARVQEFQRTIKTLHPKAWVIGSGGCTRCEKCTYPDAPCRFPDEITPSMEALGMVVSDVCKDNDFGYYYGKGTITYTSCVLL